MGIPKYIPSKAAEVVKITIATQDGEVVITEEDLKNKARSVNNVDHKTVSHTIYSRNDFVREYTKHRAKGKCDLCHNDAPFLNKDNKPYLETHHLIMLSENGPDAIFNTVALCPNCHRKMHSLDLDSDKIKLIKTIQNYLIEDELSDLIVDYSDLFMNFFEEDE